MRIKQDYLDARVLRFGYGRDKVVVSADDNCRIYFIKPREPYEIARY